MSNAHKLTAKELARLTERLTGLSGAELAAEITSKRPENRIKLFLNLPLKDAAEAFDYFPHTIQKQLLATIPLEHMAKVLEAMYPDDRTALLQTLPKDEAEKYIKLFSEEERKLTLTLLSYPEDKVGHYMTTDYLAVKMDWTVEKVLNYVREYGHDSETINIIFVIDDRGRLIDDIKIKDFLFVPKNYKVSQIADGKFIALKAHDDAEQAISLFQEYDRVALPVLNEHKKLLGIVTIDDILRLSAEESTEDMQKVGGTEALEEPYMETPFFELMKKRSRWLIVLFIGELLTASAMGYFEDEIAKAVVLALFLPLIISSGGNAGSQSSTLIIRAMALGEVTLSDWWKVMRREIFSGLFLGCLLGTLGFTRVALWGIGSNVYGEHWLLIAFTIFFSLTGVVMWGSFAGSMLPLVLRRLGADPAVSSAPLVATLVDVTGITLYFSIAMIILRNTLLS